MIVMHPSFDFENALWEKGIQFVAGADEVGRGAFAGPVVASAVVFDSSLCSFSSRPLRGSQKTAPNWMNQIIIRDSKKMTPKQRELASEWIKENCLAWAVGEASVIEINRFGIVNATNKAFRRAVKNLKIEALLVDAFYIPNIPGIKKKNQTPIIKGDNLSISIAAASIVAKVHRDRLMLKLGKNYNHYNWGKNKGYGTLEHRTAIAQFGICSHHRRAFVKPFVFQG